MFDVTTMSSDGSIHSVLEISVGVIPLPAVSSMFSVVPHVSWHNVNWLTVSVFLDGPAIFMPGVEMVSVASSTFDVTTMSSDGSIHSVLELLVGVIPLPAVSRMISVVPEHRVNTD